jgi:hypothetical protein
LWFKLAVAPVNGSSEFTGVFTALTLKISLLTENAMESTTCYRYISMINLYEYGIKNPTCMSLVDGVFIVNSFSQILPQSGKDAYALGETGHEGSRLWLCHGVF